MENIDVLKEDLLKLNKTYEDNNPQATRFKFKKWFRALVVSVTDAACSIFDKASISTSIAGSAAANNLLTSIENSLSKDNKEPDLKPQAMENLEEGSAGYIHNQAIINLYTKYGDRLKEIPIKKLLSVSMEEVSKITGRPCPAINDEACKIIENAVSLLDFEKSVRENIVMLSSLTDDEIEKEELEICGVLLDGLQYVEDNDTTYYINAREIINNSEISPEQKETLHNSLSIAYASAKLWNEPNME